MHNDETNNELRPQTASHKKLAKCRNITKGFQISGANVKTRGVYKVNSESRRSRNFKNIAKLLHFGLQISCEISNVSTALNVLAILEKGPFIA